jgi:outer membrane biosynthesis protein TonB
MALSMGTPRATSGISGPGGKNVNPMYQGDLVQNSKPKAKPTQTPKSDPKPTVKPTVKPTPKPTAKPTAKPTPKPVSKSTPGGFTKGGVMPTGRDY